jgi:hypothetical protein
MRKPLLEIIGEELAVTFEQATDIPPSAGGKFMAAPSRMSGNPTL